MRAKKAMYSRAMSATGRSRNEEQKKGPRQADVDRRRAGSGEEQ